MGGHLPDAQRPAYQIPERGVRTSFIGNIEASVGQVANARSKAEAQQVAEGKYMVRESCGVGVVFFNLEIRLVVEQSIEYMRSISYGRVDHLGVKRPTGRTREYRRALRVQCRNED